MDFSALQTHITEALLAQGWQLADPHTLAQEIWLNDETLSARESTKQLPFHYAAHLYAICRAPEHPDFSQAWEELKNWLTKNVSLFTTVPAEQDDLVQETLIELNTRLPSNPLKTPRALWAYLLQIMRNKHTDHHRRATAVKRGEDNLLSLEDLNDASGNETATSWEEIHGTQTNPRATEDQVTAQDLRQRLVTLFQTHLRSENQIQVAEAHFLDGLSPQEIADLWGKKPHEIRMIKARIVQTLRDLPPTARQELFDILDKFGEEKDSDYE
ncbi:MAG TPA: sigma-70 family RNA polymerase sigma factor [Anaerolineales bacterium]|nr:sigma-70 family RNA polymerase sigma factor [Anaerolineales bacterium]